MLLKKVKKDGLSVEEFVDVMLRKLPKRTRDQEIELVASLVELFEQIDINGDGVMIWSEFTSYCVEAGLVATRLSAPQITHKYVQDIKYEDASIHGDFVKHINYVPQLNVIFVCEAGSPYLKMYDLKKIQCYNRLYCNLSKSLKKDDLNELGDKLQVNKSYTIIVIITI